MTNIRRGPGRGPAPVPLDGGASSGVETGVPGRGSGNTIPLFRPEALDAHRSPHETGDIVRLSPRWGRRPALILLAVLVAAFVFALTVPVTEHASGPAILRSVSDVDIPAPLGAPVREVLVQPGDAVAEGDVLLLLEDAEALLELESVQTEFDLQLVRLLRDPRDAAARQTLAGLRPRLDLAAARVARHRVVAPRAGIVTDLWIEEGGVVLPGETVATLSSGESELEVVTLLPARHRPSLEPGMGLRLELDGLERRYIDLVVTEIGSEARPVASLLRTVGREVGRGLDPSEPRVLVRAILPGEDLGLPGENRRLHPGMAGRVEIPIRRQRLVSILLPEFGSGKPAGS